MRFSIVTFRRLAATELLHGRVPWWNYFEGLGQPLVGEGKSEAVFLVMLLFALSKGLVWFPASLEVIADASTYRREPTNLARV